MPDSLPASSRPSADRRFCTTHWTEVIQAARPGATGSQDAFARLYLDYWTPLYAYVRRRGHGPEAAEDIIQDFFTRLLDKQALTRLTREGGRFRSFLLASLNHFLANQWNHARAQKRGGGQELLSMDAEEGETRFLTRAPAVTDPPEVAFEKEWAFTLLERVARQLEDYYTAEGKSALFHPLRVYLQGTRNGPPYVETAARLALSEGAVKVAVHRMRQHYGALLREEIARTVSRPEEVDEELRHLIRVVGR